MSAPAVRQSRQVRTAGKQPSEAGCSGSLRPDAAGRQLMAETTAEFQAVNGVVRGLEAGLAGRLRRPDLAALLRASQDGERDVLRFTLVLQSCCAPGGS